MSKLWRYLLSTALLALAVAGWLGSRAPAAPPEERFIPLRWEYRVVAVHPVIENLQKELDKLGGDGFEVCGSTGGAIQHVILKRHRR